MLYVQGILKCDNACDNLLTNMTSVRIHMHMNGLYSTISILKEDVPEGWHNFNDKYFCPTCSKSKVKNER